MILLTGINVVSFPEVIHMPIILNKGFNYTIRKIDNGSEENAASLNEEVVAAIMGALMAFMSDYAVSDLKIKSIRRTGTVSPVWNIAGRQEYIAAKL